MGEKDEVLVVRGKLNGLAELGVIEMKTQNVVNEEVSLQHNPVSSSYHSVSRGPHRGDDAEHNKW